MFSHTYQIKDLHWMPSRRASHNKEPTKKSSHYILQYITVLKGKELSQQRLTLPFPLGTQASQEHLVINCTKNNWKIQPLCVLVWNEQSIHDFPKKWNELHALVPCIKSPYSSIVSLISVRLSIRLLEGSCTSCYPLQEMDFRNVSSWPTRGNARVILL